MHFLQKASPLLSRRGLAFRLQLSHQQIQVDQLFKEAVLGEVVVVAGLVANAGITCCQAVEPLGQFLFLRKQGGQLFTLVGVTRCVVARLHHRAAQVDVDHLGKAPQLTEGGVADYAL